MNITTGEIVTLVLAVLAALLIAWRIGGSEGAKGAVKYLRARDKQARKEGLRALEHQMALARKLAATNGETDPTVGSGFLRLPTHAFETAFLGDRPPLSDAEVVFEALNAYLIKAYGVNGAIEAYNALITTTAGMRGQDAQRLARVVRQECAAMAPLLDALDMALQAAREA